MPEQTPLLQVSSLNISFKVGKGRIHVADNVSFSINPGEVMALVGESGSGKSVTALSMLRLLASPPAKVEADGILFRDVNLADCSEAKLRTIRGNRISMIYQEPMTSLNPTLTIGRQITETLRLHKGMSQAGAFDTAAGLLTEVGIPEPERQLRSYPHQLSGGMRQRVMIAIALACGPDLLIADEPTTALDVTIQAQIMDLINELRLKNHMAVLLITHNMGIVAETADTVAVMYAGQIVERAPCGDIFTLPLHPYTRGLLDSVPSLSGERRKLSAIPGNVPSPSEWPSGCRFHPRCVNRKDGCDGCTRELAEAAPGHFTRCPYF